jgi:hypothetical protein
LAIGRFVPSVSRPSSPIGKRSGIPVDHFELSSRSSSPSPILGSKRHQLPSSRFLFKVGLIVTILGLRVELFRRVTLHNECAPAGYAVSLMRCVLYAELQLLIAFHSFSMRSRSSFRYMTIGDISDHVQELATLNCNRPKPCPPI